MIPENFLLTIIRLLTIQVTKGKNIVCMSGWFVTMETRGDFSLFPKPRFVHSGIRWLCFLEWYGDIFSARPRCSVWFLLWYPNPLITMMKKEGRR